MSKTMSSVVFLLLFLVVMDSASLVFSGGIPRTLQGSVLIYNQIGIGVTPVEVRCKSETNEVVISETALLSGQRVGWGFQYSIWGHTRYICNFKWGSRTQEFNVWVDANPAEHWRVPPPCTHCVWHVVPEGFKAYESTGVLGTVVAEYAWRTATREKIHRSP
ncbi:hypothetical protein KC19_6G214800 [Ceratodon purpureus]|uniref:S-protein homolog n=1 Tax=Ceratodon purpureus TaxID=3225 RepID=A0A8T0HK23_CERPU|nr:hypothetical protein KC19_6G214800 [Ceratodon purpureus]